MGSRATEINKPKSNRIFFPRFPAFDLEMRITKLEEVRMDLTDYVRAHFDSAAWPCTKIAEVFMREGRKIYGNL